MPFLKNPWIKIGVSVLLTLLLVKFYIGGLIANAMYGYTVMDIVCAARDIPEGTVLQSSDLKTHSIPKQFLQPGAFVAKLPGQEMSQIIGQMSLIAIPGDSQITKPMIGRPELKAIDRVIPTGKRAYPLLVSRSEITRLINVGTRIDVIANVTVRNENGLPTETAKTVLQNIVVLAVRDEIMFQNTVKDSKKETIEGVSLTLAVTPAEAEQLSLAEKVSNGDIRVIIRPFFDK